MSYLISTLEVIRVWASTILFMEPIIPGLATTTILMVLSINFKEIGTMFQDRIT
jgi:hypothetical protein